MQKLREQIEAQMAAHLDDHPFWQALATDQPDGFSAVRDTLLAPGRRLRPQLFCAACLDAGRDPFPDLASVALALELSHNFILIHDDIMDRSAQRRGRPTLPERMKQLFREHPAEGFRGEDFALVAGDLLYTLAVESLLQPNAPDSHKTEALRLFTRAALDTGRGALLEMHAARSPLNELTPEQIETVYALKTGRYTFALPLQLAGVFSNVGKEERKDFPTLGRHAGIAFQLQNDRHDTADDLRDGRRTWALVSAGSVEAFRNGESAAAVEEAVQRHTAKALALAGGPTIKAVLEKALSATA